MTTVSAHDAAAPVLSIDPFSPECLFAPYPSHQLMREAGPVVRLDRYGIWAVARHSEVRAVLADWENFCSSAGVGLSNYRREKPWRPPGLLLEADPPVHDRARRVLTRILSPTAVKALKTQFEMEAVRLVDELIARGHFDAIEHLAERFPIQVFSDAVGLPQKGRDKLLPYGKLIFNAFGPRNDLYESAVSEAQGFQSWVVESCSREALTPGMLGAQIYAAADAGEIAQDEAPRLVRAFISAGLDTTVSALGNAIHLFGLYPEQWTLLREDASLVRNAFEEVLRFETPFQMFFRTATRAVELSGQRIGADEKILVSIAAANRDPRQWPEPDHFDVKRRALGHMAMGTGIHACVGQMIARLEGEVVLAALAQKVDRIEITGEPERRLNNTLRGLKRLPVALHAATD
jgi:4-methoxybenzoate monooxygenase (O-demethylating)